MGALLSSGFESNTPISLQPQFSKFKCHGFAQIASAHKNGVQALVGTDNSAYFRSQFRHVVAVTLLSEAAETVQILPYLGGGKFHTLRKLAR